MGAAGPASRRWAGLAASNGWKASWLDLQRDWAHAVETLGWLKANLHPASVSGRRHRMAIWQVTPPRADANIIVHRHREKQIHSTTSGPPESGLSSTRRPALAKHRARNLKCCCTGCLAPRQVHRAPNGCVPPATARALRSGRIIHRPTHRCVDGRTASSWWY